MFGHPGKKLLFMGGEWGQWREWVHEESIEWHAIEYPSQRGLIRWLADLNRFYISQPAMHQQDFENGGFEWIDCHDWEGSTISFIRRGENADGIFLVGGTP